MMQVRTSHWKIRIQSSTDITSVALDWIDIATHSIIYMYNKHPFFLDKHLLGSHHRNCCCRIFFHDEEVHELETWFRSHFHGCYDVIDRFHWNDYFDQYRKFFVFKHLGNYIYNSTRYPLFWILYSKIWVFVIHGSIARVQSTHTL